MRYGKIACAAIVSAAMSFSSTAAVASACQPGPGGCLLPLGAAPPPVVTTAPPVVTTPVVDPIIEEAGGGGIGLLPIIAGIVGLGALAYFLLEEFQDDEDDDRVSP